MAYKPPLETPRRPVERRSASGATKRPKVTCGHILTHWDRNGRKLCSVCGHDITYDTMHEVT